MGLDFFIQRTEAVGECGWSYGGFSEFRERLAAEVSIPLREMPGFARTPTRKWPDPKDEPLVLLLDHPDNEGWLDSEACAAIYPRLREIVRRWPEADYDRVNALLLADAMEEVATDDDLYLEFA